MIKVVLFVALMILVTVTSALAEAEVAIILSQEIIPYRNAVAGFRKELKGFDFDEYTLDGETSHDRTLAQLQQNPPSLILSVGPEATVLMKEHPLPSPTMFTMILNPSKIISPFSPTSGVSLNYSPDTVLEAVKKSFPDRKTVGIFFSPDINASLVGDYGTSAAKIGLEIVPFPVSTSSDVRSILQTTAFAPEVILFIPDRVITREKLITYIIQECLFRSVPAVGFNSWFARSGGAVLSLYLNYEEVGRQTAAIARRILQNRNSAPTVELPHNLRIIVNDKVAKKFNIAVSDEIKTAADAIIE
nr:hypothetical protein [Deltaproteobacteria bacterium]